MNIKAEWRIVDGRPFIAVTLPGGFTVSLPQYLAWQVKNELQRVLSTAPPRRPDNGQREDRSSNSVGVGMGRRMGDPGVDSS